MASKRLPTNGVGREEMQLKMRKRINIDLCARWPRGNLVAIGCLTTPLFKCSSTQ